MIDSLRFLPTVHCIESTFKLMSLCMHYQLYTDVFRLGYYEEKIFIFIFELCYLIHCLYMYHGGFEERFYFNGNDDLT